MAWDSSRPVPWQRLVREWLIYVAIMGAVLFVVFRDGSVVGSFAGLLVSGPLYLLMGFVLAKFGYQRKSLNELRTPQAEPRASKRKSKQGSTDDDASATSTASDRNRPAPTRRTSGGGNRPKSRPRRR